MNKIAALIVLLAIMNCAVTKTKNSGTREVDGIIYLDASDSDKNERKIKPAPKSTAQKSTVQQQQDDAENLRNFKEMDGIIFLDSQDQDKDAPGTIQQFNQKFETGKASFYSLELKGRRTASGEIYDPNQLSAAHPTLPFGTKVKVTNLYNNQSVIVRINDRGPHTKARIIDVSYAAAQKLDMIKKGIAQVAVEVIK